VARLSAIAQRHARWRELTEAETTAAVAEFPEIAAAWSDLLAEVAGILLGFHEWEARRGQSERRLATVRHCGAPTMT
jgi:hypothetical protein